MKTQKERLLELFQLYGNRLTLGQLLKYPEGYKCTSRFSELRKQGYQINFHKGKTPSENVYELVYFNKNNQAEMNL